jgi:Holliday junction DNA helicase subunit RuvB
VRDYAEVRGKGQITKAVADMALNLLDVDERGFDHSDRRLLLTMIEKFDGGPVGVDNLARHQRGAPHHRGCARALPDPAGLHHAHAARRVVTRHAYLHFGLNVPGSLGGAGEFSEPGDE